MAVAERTIERKRGNWVCYFCNRKYPNTMRWCPSCNIAKKHSDNLHENITQQSSRGIDRI